MQLCVLAGADCPSSARPARAAQHADHLPVSARRPPASYWRASQPAADRSGFRLHASSLIRWSRKRAYGGGQPPREPTTCRTTGAGASQPAARQVAGPRPTASLAHRRVVSSSPLSSPTSRSRREPAAHQGGSSPRCPGAAGEASDDGGTSSCQWRRQAHDRRGEPAANTTFAPSAEKTGAGPQKPGQAHQRASEEEEEAGERKREMRFFWGGLAAP